MVIQLWYIAGLLDTNFVGNRKDPHCAVLSRVGSQNRQPRPPPPTAFCVREHMPIYICNNVLCTSLSPTSRLFRARRRRLGLAWFLSEEGPRADVLGFISIVQFHHPRIGGQLRVSRVLLHALYELQDLLAPRRLEQLVQMALSSVCSQCGMTDRYCRESPSGNATISMASRPALGWKKYFMIRVSLLR